MLGLFPKNGEIPRARSFRFSENSLTGLFPLPAARNLGLCKNLGNRFSDLVGTVHRRGHVFAAQTAAPAPEFAASTARLDRSPSDAAVCGNVQARPRALFGRNAPACPCRPSRGAALWVRGTEGRVGAGVRGERASSSVPRLGLPAVPHGGREVSWRRWTLRRAGARRSSPRPCPPASASPRRRTVPREFRGTEGRAGAGGRGERGASRSHAVERRIQARRIVPFSDVALARARVGLPAAPHRAVRRTNGRAGAGVRDAP